MAMCPSCNRFVGVEMAEPEVDASVSETSVEGSVRLVLTCAECGEELKEANPYFVEDIDHECEKSDSPEFEVVNTLADATDRFQDKDRHGKPIKSFRYMRHFYGADVTITLKCLACEEEFDVTLNAEEQASAFDDLW